MSAYPTPASVAPPRPVAAPRMPAGVSRMGRALVLVALVLLVPGEAARVGADLVARD